LLGIDLTNRTAVVTGGASGIGRAAAIRLARAGARVFSGDLAPRAENEPRFEDLEIDTSVCDVRQLDQLQRLIDRAAERTGRLDILVSNAGITQVGQVRDPRVGRLPDTNLRPFFGAKFAIPICGGPGRGDCTHRQQCGTAAPRP
jgi:NAD(P)-dependent dehydrogenase (short-subunit alcohol dehydrogenase family)